MDTLSASLTPGIGYLLTLIFGLWTSKAGRPYSGLLFNIHKLIALGTVIITALQVHKFLRILVPQALIILLVVITAIGVVALFASGTFLSIGNMNYAVVKAIHNIAPVVVVIAMGLTIYLLVGKML